MSAAPPRSRLRRADDAGQHRFEVPDTAEPTAPAAAPVPMGAAATTPPAPVKSSANTPATKAKAPAGEARTLANVAQLVVRLPAALESQVIRAMQEDLPGWLELHETSRSWTMASYTEAAVEYALKHLNQWLHDVPPDARLIVARERGRAKREKDTPTYPSYVPVHVAWKPELVDQLADHARKGSPTAVAYSQLAAAGYGKTRLHLSKASLVAGALEWALAEHRRLRWTHQVKPYGG